MKLLAELFLSFLKIGLFTFGGGYAMIPLIQREVIDRKRWIAEAEYLDLLTLAQSAPGPISLNTSVFVGYKLRGYAGAAAAISGIVVPSFTILLLVALFFSAEVRYNPVVDAAFKGMRPAVVALIAVPVISLAKSMHLRPAMFIIVAASALIVWGTRFSPILLLVVAAVAGIAWELLVTRKKMQR